MRILESNGLGIPEELFSLMVEYDSLRDNQKKIKERMEKLRQEIIDYLVSNGKELYKNNEGSVKHNIVEKTGIAQKKLEQELMVINRLDIYKKCQYKYSYDMILVKINKNLYNTG